MSLKEQLNSDLRQAMLARETIRVSTLRLAKAALQKKEIEQKAELSDSEVLDILSRELKQRNESIQEFERAGRSDLIAKCQEEIEVLKHYLPEQFSEAELVALIEEAVSATGASSPKDMGKIMGWLMPKTKGRADGKLINRLVNERLNQG